MDTRNQYGALGMDISREEPVEYEPSDESDLILQLHGKIRQQAARLKALEQYKNLCEDRITDLCPGHPLPVEAEHLGNRPGNNELQQAKQHIRALEQRLDQRESQGQRLSSRGHEVSLEQYNKLLFNFNELQRHKDELERSLRLETLNVEQQRTYIEVLKQAVEAKKGDLGFDDLPVESFSDVIGLKNRLSQTSQQATRLDAANKDLYARMERISQENEKLKERLSTLMENEKRMEVNMAEAADALQCAEFEVDKLEEEKSKLLDYITEQQEISFKSNADHTSLVEELKQAQTAIESLEHKAYKAQARVQQLEEIIHENEEKVRLVQDTQIALQLTEEKLYKRNEELGQLRNEVEELRYKYQVTDQQYKELKEQVGNVQEEKESLASSHTELANSQVQHKIRLDQTLQALQQAEDQAAEMKAKAEVLEEELTRMRENAKNVEAKLRAQVEELYMELEGTKANLQSLENTHTDASDELSALRKENNELTAQTSELQYKLQYTNQELEANKELKEQFESSYLRESQKFADLQSEYQRIELELTNEQWEVQRLVTETNALNDKLYEMSEALKTSNNNYQSADSHLEDLSNELNSTKEKLTLSDSTLYKEKEERIRLKTELIEMKHDMATMAKELAGLKEHKVNVGKMGINITNLCQNLFELKTYLNPTLRSLVNQWKDMPIQSPKDIEEWVSALSSELITVISALAHLRQSANLAKEKMEILQSRVEEYEQNYESGKDHELRNKARLEVLNSENQKLKESNFTLANQKHKLEEEVLRIQKENALLKEQQLRQPPSRAPKADPDLDSMNTRQLEYRLTAALNDKNDLQGLLNKIISAIHDGELKQTIIEILRLRREVDNIKLEKNKLNMRISDISADIKYRSSSFSAEESITAEQDLQRLRYRLQEYENLLNNYQIRMSNLEESLRLQNYGRVSEAFSDPGKSSPSSPFRFYQQQLNLPIKQLSEQ